jgi:CBS domain-containing protein
MRLVRDRMSTALITVGGDASMFDVLDVFKGKRIRHLLVVDGVGGLLGVISDRDAAGRATGPMSWLDDREMDKALHEMKAREVMTDEFKTIRSDATLADAANVVVDAKIGCLPVVDDGVLVGILCESDFVREVAGR